MGDFGNAIKYLYDKFLLRDLLSFVMPGAIVIMTGLLLFEKWGEVFGFIHAYWPLYIPLFGLFFMAGFAVQCFGEIIGFIRIHRIAKGCCHQRFKIFGCNWACKRSKEGKRDKCDEPDFIWWKEAHKEVVKFHIATKEQRDKHEWAQQQDERSVVLMQMCGNGVLAIVIAAVLLLVNHWFHLASLVLFSIVALLLLASLFWGYRVHVLRQDTMAKEIRCQLESIKEKKEPTTKES